MSELAIEASGDAPTTCERSSSRMLARPKYVHRSFCNGVEHLFEVCARSVLSIVPEKVEVEDVAIMRWSPMVCRRLQTGCEAVAKRKRLVADWAIKRTPDTALWLRHQQWWHLARRRCAGELTVMLSESMVVRPGSSVKLPVPPPAAPPVMRCRTPNCLQDAQSGQSRR